MRSFLNMSFVFNRDECKTIQQSLFPIFSCPSNVSKITYNNLRVYIKLKQKLKLTSNPIFFKVLLSIEEDIFESKILSLEFQLATMIREIYSNLVNDFNAAIIENSFQCKQTLNRKIIDDNIIKIHSSPQYEFILKYFIITLQNISYDDIENTRCQLEYKYA